MEIELTFFKETGKYYTEEAITLPDNINFLDIKDYIREHYRKENRLLGMTAYGTYKNDVPFLCYINK